MVRISDWAQGPGGTAEYYGHVSFCKQRKTGSRKEKEETPRKEMEEEEDHGVEDW